VGLLTATLTANGALVQEGRSLEVWPGRTETLRFFHRPEGEGPVEIGLELSNGARWAASLHVGDARIAIAALQALPDTVLAGDPLTVFVDLRNDGTAPGEVEVQLFANARALEKARIEVPAGATVQRAFTHALREAGPTTLKLLLEDGQAAVAPVRVVAPSLKLRDWDHDRAGCEVRVGAGVLNDGDGEARSARIQATLLDRSGRVWDERSRDLGTLEAGGWWEGHLLLRFQAPCTVQGHRIRFEVTADRAESLVWETPALS
jgi:hypothetical protein